MFRINTNTLAMNALRSLGETGKATSMAMTRLSTGLRINSAADGPADLQISEGFKTQISSIDQALRNNQDAQNYAKTAEGALSEVNSLLKQARSLALANSNDATLSTDQKQANQTQLQSIMASIDRIAQQTQYGSKKLLDGSAGVTTANLNKASLESVSMGGTFGTAATNRSVNTNGNVTIAVTTAAVKATTTGMAVANAAAAIGVDGQLTIGGSTFNVTSNMTWQNLIDNVNEKADSTGVKVAVTGGNLVFTATNFGTDSNSIQISNNVANLGFAAAGSRTLNTTTAGVNGVADIVYGGTTITGLTAQSSDGRTFKDSFGNVFKLTEDAADATFAAAALVNVTAGTANFQIGSNAGQTTSLSLNNMSSTSLSLNALDITNAAGVTAALAAIDSATTTVSNQRGNIGNFVRNTLESSFRSLGVAKENLSAANSTIADADMSEEMTNFTKLQILQQSGLSMLAQANSSSQAVLSLLRG